MPNAQGPAAATALPLGIAPKGEGVSDLESGITSREVQDLPAPNLDKAAAPATSLDSSLQIKVTTIDDGICDSQLSTPASPAVFASNNSFLLQSIVESGVSSENLGSVNSTSERSEHSDNGIPRHHHRAVKGENHTISTHGTVTTKLLDDGEQGMSQITSTEFSDTSELNVDSMSLFSHTIKIQRDTKKSTFAGVVSGSKLNDFRLHSAIELENKSKPPTPDDLNKRRPSQIVAIGGEDALRKRSTKKKAVKASHHELSDGNCGDSEDHNETTPPVKRKTSSQLGLQESISLSVDSVKLKNTKKKAVKPKNDEDGHTGDTESSLARDTRKKMVSAPVASSLDLVESNLHSMETAVDEEHSSHHQKTKHYSISQSHEIVEEKDKLIEEKILVGSPNTSLTDVNQINDSVSVPPVSPCPQAMPSSFAESESGGKEGFFMFRKLRPKSAPTKSSSRRTPVADQPKLQSIESQAAIDESLQTPKPDFIHRLFHHSNDAEDSSTGESGADDHNWFHGKFFHHQANNEEEGKEGDHPHWFHIAKRQESLFAKFFHGRSGHDDEESVGTPVLSPDSPAMSALSPQIPALPMTALSPLANEVDVEHEETPISPKEHVKSLSRRPKTADPTHRTGSDYHRDPNERPSSLFQNLKHGMISRSSSSARPKSANTDKAYSVDDTDQNMFKNLMMPKSGRSAEHSDKPRDSTDVEENSPKTSNKPSVNLSVRTSLSTKMISRKSPGARSPPSTSASRVNSNASLFDKYGKVEDFLGKGANATVRLAHKQDEFDKHEVYYAVKKFRKRHKKETEKEYIKKVIGEFCISSSLHHVNVIQTVDLIQDNRHQWCVVMEYMPGGDLYARLQEGIDDLDELNCYFKQLINGVQYIHNMGVAHRDLKPENLILDAECRILKIADFGVSEVFKTCFEKSSHKTKGVCGSEPYIAPEEWGEGAEFYATKVDVWACGIIYYALLKNSVPWHVAKSSDLHYTEYVRRRNPQYNSGFLPFDRLPEGPRNIIYHVLEPDPAIRWTVENILDDPWLKAREVCGMPELEGLNMVHTHKPPAHK